MKKFSFFVMIMVFLCAAATVYAGDLPASFDFEGYNGGIPSEWQGNNGDVCMKKVEDDEEHGTSLALYNIGADIRPELRYPMPTVSEGRFLLSFDINAQDLNKNFRITLESPTSGSLWHTIFQMNTSEEMCAWMNTASGAWDPKKMMSFEIGKWYKIDILIDMESRNIKYYVDGVYYTSSAVAFDDFNRIFFRIENGIAETEGYMYLDNVSFKYLTADGMKLFLKNDVVNAGDDTLQINFSDLIITNTLNKLQAYSMGSNPIEYTKTPIGCDIVSKDKSKIEVKFNETLEENTIYKIDIPGLTSLYGDEYINHSVYFTTTRDKSDKKVINADFSTAEIGPDIVPETDSEWTASSQYVRVALVDDLDDEGNEIPAVRFSRRGSELSLRRDFEKAFEDRVVLEYKMKSEMPMQIFKVYDSQGECIDFVTVKSDGVYYNENKLSDYIADWFTVSIELEQTENKVIFSVNGEEKGEYDYEGITDVNAVEFVQKNTEGASGDNRAKTDLAYFTASALMPGVGADLVMFEGSDGKIYYPDDDIPAKLSKITVNFSDRVKASSLEAGVKLTVNGNEENFTGEYDSLYKQYVMTLPQYLQGGSEYTIELNGVLDSSGAEIDSISGVFATESGVFECEELGIESAGKNVAITTEITHTNACYDDMYLVYAAYQGDFMVDFEATKIVPGDGERKISVSKSYTAPGEADTVRAFVWDGFDTRHPVSQVKSVSCK